MSATTASRGALLYRRLLKQVQRLPQVHRGYYRNFVRQGFASHADEEDPERLVQIADRAMHDAEWVVQKFEAEAANTAPPKPQG
mmetsp:Transcript_5390/g.13903  ORF Transcript_5390/g.13903 Transcript_5390/m.13903 type:complete len:84 (+) Transcript_5390:155-406(+)